MTSLRKGWMESVLQAGAKLVSGMALATIVFGAPSQAGESPATFKLMSQSLQDGGSLDLKQVFSGMGCQGKNLSPDLSWEYAPAGTQSFALTVYDPDAPTGSGWWHWVVYNLPKDLTHLVEGASKKLPHGAVQGKTDFGKPGFGGACPPEGDQPHHYIITLYALDIAKLAVDANATAAYVGFNLKKHSLGQAQLTATYARASSGAAAK